MIIPDANVILYAYNEDAPHHAAAKKWLYAQFTEGNSLGLSWHTITAFLRISTNPRLFPRPIDRTKAISIVDKWFEFRSVEILAPTSNHWRFFKELITEGKVTGPLMIDAHLAALCLEHDATLATTDRDFRRFPKLNTIDPLIAE